VKKHWRFVLGCSIAVLLCVLLPGLAIAKENPQSQIGTDDPSACDADPSNLVQNCGFETGHLDNWLNEGDMLFTSVTGGVVAHSGNFGASLGPLTPYGSLTQTIPTMAGATYFITFWLRNAGQPSEFGVIWDRNLYWAWPNTGDFDYMKVSIGPVPASSANTDITFFYYNTPDFFYLDDVVVYRNTGGTTQCTQIQSPTSTYLMETGKCNFGTTPFSISTMCLNSDGSLAATFNPAIQVRQVPGSWATWSSPPDSESSTPFIGYTQGATMETVTFTNSAAIAGLEVEPNPFMVFSTTASFQDASGMEVARVTRDVDGTAGARLFAVSCTNPVVAKIVVTMGADFAIAQIRSSQITGATEGEPDLGPQPIPPNATSNTQ
jgi:hypothetical protein